MTRTTNLPFRLAALALALSLATGCSWWQHRRERAAGAPAPAASAAAAELGLAPAPLPPDAEALRGASTLATDFYEMRERLGRSGLPDAGEMKAYRAFLCPGLSTAMDAARARRQEYVAAHPGDKPPLVEGDLFSSLFEGADEVSAAGTEVDGEGARVALAMRAGEGDSALRWKDAVRLQRDGGVWCIADIEYGGEWPFAHKGSLASLLAAPF